METAGDRGRDCGRALHEDLGGILNGILDGNLANDGQNFGGILVEQGRCAGRTRTGDMRVLLPTRLSKEPPCMQREAANQTATVSPTVFGAGSRRMKRVESAANSQ